MVSPEPSLSTFFMETHVSREGSNATLAHAPVHGGKLLLEPSAPPIVGQGCTQ